MIGRTISHYKIIQKLGGGGMGVVYKAEDTRLNRFVALKFLPPELTGDEESKMRLVHEAKAASSLQHNNICTIHDIDETADGQMFICMEYYEGETLKKKIERGPLKLPEALIIGAQIAEGLIKAHEKNIIHRDIKPANIFITGDGVVKILDFGLAKSSGQTQLTKLGNTVGTAAYMSPEQARGEKVDDRTDIWSLGVLIYEMISGKHPFKGDYDQALIYSIINDNPTPLTETRTGVPAGLEEIINKSLQKKSEERYRNIGDLLTDLVSLMKKNKISVSGISYSAIKTQIGRRAYVLSAAVLIIISVLLLVYYWLPGNSSSLHSVAVLPFENLGNDPEMEYLCDGITYDIISSLSQLQELKVISSFAVNRYKGKQINLQEVADELDVEAVLVGNVIYPGNNLVVRVELIDADDNRLVWGHEYSQKFTEAVIIKDNITEDISEKLLLKLTSEEKSRLSISYTSNSDAYHLYLKGLHQWNKFTSEGFVKSIGYYKQALEIDPQFAMAYASLGLSYVLEGSHHGSVPPGEIIQEARKAVLKALEMENALSEAYAVLGMIKFFYDWDWDGAEQQFIRAIELNPNSMMAHQNYALYLAALGHTEKALAEQKKALLLDPYSSKVNDDLAFTYLDLDRLDDAFKQWSFLKELDAKFPPASKGLGICYLLQGSYDQALREFQNALSYSGGHQKYKGYLGWAYGVSGKRNKALDILRELKQDSGYNKTSLTSIAIIYIGLGDKNTALDWLEKAYDARLTDMVFLKVDPYYNGLHSEPRFNDLIKKIGLNR